MSTIAPGDAMIALVRWPAEAVRRNELAAAGRPRLLLIEPGAAPPLAWDHLEDWTRLPADPADVEARIATLMLRNPSAELPSPLLDGDGILRVGPGWVALPPVEARITSVLLNRMDAVVPRRDLLAAGWPEGEAQGSKTGNILDGRIKLLRRRLTKVGLQIHTVRGVGFLLTT
jgi:DNA-binding response OmpR family regulator